MRTTTLFTSKKCNVEQRRDINTRVKQQKRKEQIPMYLDNPVKPKRSLGGLRKANKTKPKSPDLTGQMRLQRHTAAAIVKQFSEGSADEVVCNIAGWRNQDHSGSYLTVELSPCFVARTPTEKDQIIDSLINEQEDEH
jgi:hypothetical protein